MLQIEFFNRVDPTNGENHIDDTYIKVGPINSFQWTYSHLRLQTDKMDYDLPRHNKECVIYNGIYFGDFRVRQFDSTDKMVETLK
jgi:hypothetical protein